MALAHLIVDDDPAAPGDVQRFLADIGTNAFYEYKIGRRENDPGRRGAGPPAVANLADGADDALDEVVHASPLLPRGPGRNPLNSQFTLDVPAGRFSRAARDVQLFSYRDAQRNGPAASRVVRVVPKPAVAAGPPLDPWRTADGAGPSEKPLYALSRPAAASGRTVTPMTTTRRQPRPPGRGRTTRFSFQESSVAMGAYLDALLDSLRAIAPDALALDDESGAAAAATMSPDQAVAELLRKLAAAHAAASRGPATAAPAPGASPSTPAAPAPTPANAPVPATAAPSPTSGASVAASMRRSIWGASSLPRSFLPRRRSSSMSIGGQSLSALLVPALCRSPALVNVLHDRPAQLVRMLLDRARVTRRHEPAARTFSVAGQPSGVPRPSKGVTLVIDPGPTVEVSGKAKSAYRVADGGIALRVSLRTTTDVGAAPPPRPLPKAICELALVETESGGTVLTKRFQLTDVAAGAPQRLALSATELRGVPRERDLRVSAQVRWPIAGGRDVLYAEAEHAIYLVGGTALFRSLGDAEGGEVPLDDMTVHRGFWNKVWESAIPDSTQARRWELDATCRYYVRADLDATDNARIETRVLGEPPDDASPTHATAGRMKSGIELSLDALNALMPTLGGEPLTAEQLSALRSSEVRPKFDLEATTHLRMTGKRDGVGQAWVYPEVTLRRVTLSHIAAVDDAGQVTQLEDRVVRFPFPSSVHFVLLRSSAT
jgi:hypothetical protein